MESYKMRVHSLLMYQSYWVVSWHCSNYNSLMKISLYQISRQELAKFAWWEESVRHNIGWINHSGWGFPPWRNYAANGPLWDVLAWCKTYLKYSLSIKGKFYQATDSIIKRYVRQINFPDKSHRVLSVIHHSNPTTMIYFTFYKFVKPTSKIDI